MKRWAIIILIAVGISAVIGAGLYAYLMWSQSQTQELATVPFTSPTSIATEAQQKKDETLCDSLFYPDRIIECKLRVISLQNKEPDIAICETMPNKNQTVLYTFREMGPLKAISGYNYCVSKISDVTFHNYCDKISNEDIRNACQKGL